MIPTGSARRPSGILWEHLHPERVDAVPVLKELARAHGGV
jgi:hypothetical protein